jgi:hypothetical protein
MKKKTKDKCPSSEEISKVYLIDSKDCVFEKGELVRIKRQYGKFKRVICKYEKRK